MLPNINQNNDREACDHSVSNSDQNSLKHIKRHQSISKSKFIDIQEVNSHLNDSQGVAQDGLEESLLRHFLYPVDSFLSGRISPSIHK